MKKPIYIIGIIVLVLGGGYLVYTNLFSNKSQTSVSASATSTSKNLDEQATDAINQKFVQSIAGISNINLDKTIFGTSAFKSLVDFSNPLTPEANIGRINPFLPIGSDDQSYNASSTNESSNSTMITNTEMPKSLPKSPFNKQ